MIVVSYDISNDKLRRCFSKMLVKSGGIRLQYSVYEFNNTKRVIENIKLKIDNIYSPKFTPSDSVLIFTTSSESVIKYGCAIHRDQDIVFL